MTFFNVFLKNLKINLYNWCPCFLPLARCMCVPVVMTGLSSNIMSRTVNLYSICCSHHACLHRSLTHRQPPRSRVRGDRVMGLEGVAMGLEGVVMGLEGVVMGLEGVVMGLKGVVMRLEGVVMGLEGVVMGLEGVVMGLEGVVMGLEDVANGLVGVVRGLVAKSSTGISSCASCFLRVDSACSASVSGSFRLDPTSAVNYNGFKAVNISYKVLLPGNPG